MKRCSVCHKWKTRDEFYRRKLSRDGLYSECKLCRNSKVKEWRAKNPDMVKTYHNTYATKHPERRKKTCLGWRNRNIARARKNSSEWQRKNRAKSRVYVRNYQARKRRAHGTHTDSDIARLFELQKGRCWWCGKKLMRGKVHADHRIPLSRGGSNDISNIVLAHARCNISKGAKLPQEFAGRLL